MKRMRMESMVAALSLAADYVLVVIATGLILQILLTQ
jgi:hypothetical protein